jgi:hypothetical protein
MITTLTVTSLHQGFGYDEASSSAMLHAATKRAAAIKQFFKVVSLMVAVRPAPMRTPAHA